ncbi:MAG: hypothetical protein WC218_07000 [Candidatus Cloacimonadales bacterium]|nr:hypothetical protein [Candidatus Cloacimonadota bacterium]
MSKYIIFVLLIVITAALYAVDKHIPADSLYQTIIITKEDAKELKLFSQYNGFVQARLLLEADDDYYFEIIYSDEQGLVVTKEHISAAEFEQLQIRLDDYFSSKTDTINKEGHFRLILGYTYLTLGMYAPSISTNLNLDGEVAVGLYLLDSGLMLGCLLYATKDAEILNADADLSVKMANRGLLHGFLITRMIDKNMDTESLTIMSAVSIGEGYLGYKYSKKHNLTEGQANAIILYHDYVGSHYTGLAISVNAFESDKNIALVSSTALASLYSGLYYGRLMSNKIDFTKGDAIVARTTWNMYGLGSIAMSQLADLNRTQGSLLYVLMSTIGMKHGEILAQNNEFSTSYGNYLALSTVSGALMGGGLSYLFNFDKHLPLSSLGSIAGYYLYSKNHTQSSKPEKTNTSFNTSFNPFSYETKQPMLYFEYRF